MDDEKVAKVAEKYYCKICDYKCCRKNNFEKHLATAKHKKLAISKNWITLDDGKVGKVGKIETKEFVYIIKNNLKKNTPKIRYFCFVTILHNKNIIL